MGINGIQKLNFHFVKIGGANLLLPFSIEQPSFNFMVDANF